MSLTPLEPWIAGKIGRPGRLSRDALHGHQLAKLNETLCLAQHMSRFYRGSLGAAPITLASLDEVEGLPFCAAEDLRANPLDFLCVRQDNVERIVTLPTSGTTGSPKRIFFTAADQELTRDFFHHGMSTMVDPGERVLILLPGVMPGSVGELLRDGLARMDVLGIVHGPVTDAEETLDVIVRERVTALVGIPAQVLAVARLAQHTRPRQPATALRSVLLSTDRVPQAIARAVTDAFACPVYNHYGMTEMGLGGGVDCRARAGYHLREADILFEIVHPETGRPVPDGEYGEVVFTTLTRQAMPLIRYRTGDVSRFVPEPCPCGTVLRRMAHVERRAAGSIVLPDGERLGQPDLDEALFGIDSLVDFRSLYAQGGAEPTLTVEVRHITEGLSAQLVEAALLGIPAVGRNVACGRLSVQVVGWTATDENRTGTQKRHIMLQGGTV